MRLENKRLMNLDVDKSDDHNKLIELKYETFFD